MQDKFTRADTLWIVLAMLFVGVVGPVAIYTAAVIDEIFEVLL